MSSLSTVVQVNVTNQSPGVSQVGFGVPLILSRSAAFPQPFKEYRSLVELTTDFASTTATYRCAAAVFAQSPRPSKVVVGRQTVSTPQAQTIRCIPVGYKRSTVTPTAVNNTTYTLTINGLQVSYLSDASATVAEITAGLTAAVNTLLSAQGISAVDNTTSLTVSSAVYGGPLLIVGTPSVNLTIAPVAENAQVGSVYAATINGTTFQTSSDHVWTLTPIVANSTLYTVTVNGRAITYASDATATAQEIVEGLKAFADGLGATDFVTTENDLTITFTGTALLTAAGLTVTFSATQFTRTAPTITVAEVCARLTAKVNANVALPVTAADSTTHFTLSSDVAGLLYTLSLDRRFIRQKDFTLASNPVADLNNVQSYTDDFYAILPTENFTADNVLLAAHVAGLNDLPKMLFISSADDDCYDSGVTTDVASVLEATSNTRCAFMYHPDSYNAYPNAAWAGKVLPDVPGSATWKFKTLTSVAATNLNSGEISALDAKSANHYTSIANVAITREGVTTTLTHTDFIDITHLIDWIKVRMQEEIFAKLSSLKKIPYTNQGAAVVESIIRAVLQTAITNGGIADDPAPTVFVPDVRTVSAINKANRVLPDCTFSATLAGAIHRVIINGTVSV